LGLAPSIDGYVMIDFVGSCFISEYTSCVGFELISSADATGYRTILKDLGNDIHLA